MNKILPLSVLLTLFAGFSLAQCPVSQVEIRVDIATDNWGYETYWTITDMIGTVILEGGQDGVYDNNSDYSESICVADDGCFFFEIWDEYGDGIYAPNGYELYVNEILVSSGSDDIEDYAIATAHCPNQCNMTTTALNDLQEHINGISPLTAAELLLIKNIFEQFPECLAETEAMILLGKSVLEDFDDEVGALFTTPNTVNGFSKDAVAAPGMELEHAMVALEQGILDYVFSPEVYSDYPQHLSGWLFNTCFTFPGYVDPPADSSLSNFTLIRANFADPDGANPYFEINSDQTDHALRPTGLYLSPGSIATVTVPDSLVGQGYFVRVGSHDWDLHIRPNYHRLDRISKKFPIESNTVEVFNPFGGAISILVPYGADDGIVEVSVTNGVECPFFSLKSFHTTSDFNAELNKPGPWAVFETDNVMFTIPSHSIVPGQYDLMQAMLDWDAALQGVNSVMARQIISDKHNMYMIADITIRHNVYSIGYPMSNTPLRFTDVPGPAYFINGPGPDDETNFHESGHALAMTKFPGEVEAIVNFPYIMAMNHGLNQDLNEAINYSFVPNTFDLDKTATHRMVSNSFGTDRNISNTTMDEVRYQHRGYGHYFEIVNMLGWCPLRNFWKQEFIDTENGADYGINNQDIDSRILRMSAAAQVDLRPLFHVFGILPQDPISLQEEFDQLNILPSEAIYSRLQDYFTLIPEDNAAFVWYALNVYPTLGVEGPTASPDYGVGWHYQKSLTYDAAEAQQRTDILQGIVDLYFPNGEPTGPAADVCCMLDPMNVSMVNEEVLVTGGVEPYDISIDTTGNVQIITVIDFDGCESNTQYAITSLSELVEEGFRVFPNPSTGDLQIDFGTLEDEVTISALDLRGKLIQTTTVITKGMLIYRLPEATGVYLLKITYSDGIFDSVRIIKE